MRYIPQSKYSFDEIVEQCKCAINNTQDRTDVYAEVRKFYHYADDNIGKVFHLKDYPSLVK